MNVFLLFAAALYCTGIGYVYQARGMALQAFAFGITALLLAGAIFRAALRSRA